MTTSAHTHAPPNRVKTVWFYPFAFTRNAPRKGNRAPLNQIKYNAPPRKGWRGVPDELVEAIPLNKINCNEQRDGETGYGYLPHQARQAHHDARYMDNGLMTMWLIPGTNYGPSTWL